MMLELLLFTIFCSLVTARDHFIIGGTEVTQMGKWPWQGSVLGPEREHVCGCVLVHESWMLTAAHCLTGTNYRAEFGMLELGSGTTFRIESVAIHPNYGDNSVAPGSFPFDIAVLNAESPVFGANILPISLTDATNQAGNPECWSTGWGRTVRGGQLPTTLHEVNIPVIANASCFARWSTSFNSDIHICAWDSQNKDKGNCDVRGDDGGPLMCFQDDELGGRWRLEGIGSWHYTGCNTEWPFVFTRVQAMKDFICDATLGVVAPGYCTFP